MFTGLIQDVGRIESIRPSGTGSILRVVTSLAADGLERGESIACNGTCLTVTGFDAKGFTCEASRETLERTTIGDLKQGSPLNLERALRVGDRLGGHLVQGHVDGRATLVDVQPDGTSRKLYFDLPAGLVRYVIGKGSIALDGISLTVNEIEGRRFWVNIIPATWENTNLSGKKVGEHVNVEVDQLGKYVERLLLAWLEPGQQPGDLPPGVTRAFLAEHGFLKGEGPETA